MAINSKRLEALENAPHVIGHWCGKIYLLFGHRMDEAKFGSVKHEARRRDL